MATRTTKQEFSEAARLLGKKGGKAKSDLKTEKCRINASRPRPRSKAAVA